MYTYIKRSHEHIRELLDRVTAAMAADAPDDIGPLWSRLEDELRSHMEVEERCMLPAFAHVDANEARTLLREHGEIRERLLELGVAVDLRYVRYHSSRAFAELLEHHTAREERLLYRWADKALDSDVIERAVHHVQA